MKNTTDIVDAPIHEKESDYHFSVGSYFPPQFKFVGFAFVILGLFLILKISIIGAVFLLLGLVFVLAKKTLTVSFTLSKYRSAFEILKMPFGEWESFPAFESISIFSAKRRQDMAAASQSMTAYYSEIEVNLIYNRNRRLTVFITKDFNKALEVAKKFADKLKLDIYDASQREGKWIE